MIPKIIHQTAPIDKKKWHPVWSVCQDSWKRHFPENEYKYILWNDEDLDNLVKQDYPEYWDFYENLPLHIIKIDFARFLILQKFGGIYVDMDMYCYENFYNNLNKNFCIIGSSLENEIVQNSLMISNPQNNFCVFCIKKIIQNFVMCSSEIKNVNSSNIFTTNISEIISNYVKTTSGPDIISIIYEEYLEKDSIQILSDKKYNPDIPKNTTTHIEQWFDDWNDKPKTIHMLTGHWGSEVLKIFDEQSFVTNKSFENYAILLYQQNRCVSFDKLT